MGGFENFAIAKQRKLYEFSVAAQLILQLTGSLTTNFMRVTIEKKFKFIVAHADLSVRR